MNDLSSRASVRGSVETRSRPFDGAELREWDGGNTLRFTGYASVTETPYEMQDYLGDYTEVVRRGAFTKTLAEGADVPFKVNHDGITLARTKSGTMRLAEDSTGLHVEADLDPASPAVQTLRSAMTRGDLDEMSFGFRVTRQEWSPDWTQRDISEVNLNKGDVSAVNYGANPATSGLTSLRSRDAIMRMIRDVSADVEPDVQTRLMHVLKLLAAADAAVDVAQPILASVLGVENPDEDDDEDESGEPEQLSVDLSLYQARLRALSL